MCCCTAEPHAEEGSAAASVLSAQRGDEEEGYAVIALEEVPHLDRNMASPAGCEHYVRSCLLKVS